MVENATGEKTSVKRNGERLGRAQRTRTGGSENKTPDTFFTSRSLKNCIFVLVAHRASSKKGIGNEKSASRARKKKPR